MLLQVNLVCLCFLSFVVLTTTLNEGSFWHVTDFHYDNTYSVEDNSCYDNVTLPEKREFGNGWCDSPWKLVNNSVQAMKALHPDVDFIIWTGDSVYHATHEAEQLNTSVNLGILDDITNLLKTVFPDTPTFPCFGNHDYFPDAQFPVNENDMYRHMVESWAGWINRSKSEDFKKGGYYSLLIPSGKIRMISLNTNLFYTSNKQVSDIADPADHFTWLETVLSNAKTNGEKVIVIGHVPPGVKTPDGFLWFYAHHNDRFIEIINKYLDIIAALHFGHDHEDEFKMFYNKDDKATVPMFLAPSVTPWRYKIPTRTGPARNPGVRLVKYDRDTGAHLNYIQYYLDLNKANKEGVATWETLYDAKTAYGVADVSAESLHTIRGKFISQNGGDIQDYFRRMEVNGDLERTCDRKCQHEIYCGMKHFQIIQFKECLNKISSARQMLSNPVVLLAFLLAFILF